MIPPLCEHQKRIVDEDKKWTGIFQGTGAMKTRTALEIAEGQTLVICPKQQREDETWQDNMRKFDIRKDVTVISKEDFRRDYATLSGYDTVIVDECHHMLGVLPETRQRNKVLIPKASQLFEGLQEYLLRTKPTRFYLLSATPVTKPMHVWAIGKLFGRDWDFFAFRQKFYVLVSMGPHNDRWIPKSEVSLANRLIELTKSLGYTGGLADFFDVPEQVYITKHFGLTEQQKKAIKDLKNSNADPMAVRSYTRSIENGVLYGSEIVQISEKKDKLIGKTTIFDSEKIDYIVERAAEFPKMLIFAAYTAQVESIHKALKVAGYEPVVVTGAVKDRSTVFKEAEARENAIMVVQSSISEGYEFTTCPVVMYASCSNKARDRIQGDGRVQRGHRIKTNLYIDLVVKGGLDEQCFDTVRAGVDFNEKIMQN